MRTTLILLLFTLAICADIEAILNDLRKRHKMSNNTEEKTEISDEECDKCENDGFCPLACRKYLLKKMGQHCEECEKAGNCPLICKKYFINKKCEKCRKERNCDDFCKHYLKQDLLKDVKNVKKMALVL